MLLERRSEKRHDRDEADCSRGCDPSRPRMRLTFPAAAWLASCALAAEPPAPQAHSSPAYAETGARLVVNPAKDGPRYPLVEPANAIATWTTELGFKLELAAHEPEVRDPIAISFDENGRM